MAYADDDQQKRSAEPYTPSAEEQSCLRLVEDRFDIGQQIRRPHEGDWFVVGAFARGHQYVEWSSRDNRLNVPPAPRNRIRIVINLMQPKMRARLAKFLKNRPVPVVVPATTDLDDRLDARATTKALDFAWQKCQLEAAYGQALRWSAITDHGYWWFSWDSKALAKVQIVDELTKQVTIQSLPVGDIDIEVGSPFELVVGDPTLSAIGDQPWIIRVKRRLMSYIEARYDKKAKFVSPDGDDRGGEAAGDRYAQQLGRLAAHAGGAGASLTQTSESSGKARGEPYVLVKEYFERPCDKYPKGRYIVVGGGVILREQDELPFFHDFKKNPYPCVDFVDFPQVGQYWGTTIAAQVVQPQREYNLYHSKLAEHQRLMPHPKLITYKQHGLQPGVWTADAGEVIVANWIPGLPEIKPWHPPPISPDIWKGCEVIKKEIEDIFQIFPESEGRVGQSTSGFQTNLLQEATDAVHAPDIRAHELAIEEAAYKVRRLMKLGYAPERLLSITGKDFEPESFEFHRDDIDETADIRVQAGSALPTLKAAKTQAVMEMWTSGILGDPADPQSRQKALSMLEMGGSEEIYDSVRKDEEMAKVENKSFANGEDVADPEFFENHDVHYKSHTDDMKSMSAKARPLEVQTAERRHTIRHIGFVNPQAAIEHALRYGFMDIAQQIQMEAQSSAQHQMMPPGAQAPQGSGGGQPPPPGGPTG